MCYNKCALCYNKCALCYNKCALCYNKCALCYNMSKLFGACPVSLVHFRVWYSVVTGVISTVNWHRESLYANLYTTYGFCVFTCFLSMLGMTLALSYSYFSKTHNQNDKVCA